MEERVTAQVAVSDVQDSVVRSWYLRPELWLLVLFVLAMHLPRLGEIPICGEESRWATVARGMLDSGDWLVPRQQGAVFPDRPPLGIWPIAGLALLRGEVDEMAIRIPSVIAVTLAAVLIYGYGSFFMTRVGALLTAMFYPTTVHMLQLGGLGESDAQFSLYIAASLLIWHAGYERGISAQWVWSAGYSLAACGALVKGLQAPVYFVAATWIWLALRGDWKYLFSWRQLVGTGCFAVVLGAWQIPYLLATDMSTAIAMWTNGPAKRYVFDGLLKHLFAYPLETFGCLLPWSPLLLMYGNRRWRASLDRERPFVSFLSTAALVCYLPLWFAAEARGRYFMPLYPSAALLAGVVLDRFIVAASASTAAPFWRRYVWSTAVCVAFFGLALGTASTGQFPRLQPISQSPAVIVCVWLICITVTGLLIWSTRRFTPRRIVIATLATAVFFAVGFKVVVTNVVVGSANDPAVHVAAIQRQLPPEARLVSFTAIHHRFEHYFGSAIEERPWPETAEDVPAEVDYFCFVRRPSDTAQQRLAGRVWNFYTTTGGLPFPWEEVGTVSMARKIDETDQPVVVVGRVKRDTERLAAVDGQTPH